MLQDKVNVADNKNQVGRVLNLSHYKVYIYNWIGMTNYPRHYCFEVEMDKYTNPNAKMLRTRLWFAPSAGSQVQIQVRFNILSGNNHLTQFYYL